MKKWPNTQQSQECEIKEFIRLYKIFAHGRDFVIEESQREKPDYIVKDVATGEKFGVELTSTYLNDRSVPDVHKKEGFKGIPYCPNEINLYKNRIIKKIKEKIEKARKEYDVICPLILSIYANEYITIHMEDNDWNTFAKENKQVLDLMQPFIEIVIWSLHGRVFSIRNST